MKSSKKTSQGKSGKSDGKKGKLRDLKPRDKDSREVAGGGNIGPQKIPPVNFDHYLVCDKALKENFVDVDVHDTLTRLSRVPIATWNYKEEGSAVRHIGPMAQDFAAAFPLGQSDTRVSMIDAHGVAFAAIQALYQTVQKSDRELKALRAEVKKLRSAS